MKKKTAFLLTFCLCLSISITAQDINKEKMDDQTALPYYNIPDYPEEYSANTVAARILDGLGYRYFWATEGLSEADLSFKPSEDGRTIGETTEHIYGLTRTTLNAVQQEPNIRPSEKEVLDFPERRKKTLENIKMASDILKESRAGDMEDFNIIFQRGENKSEFPFWNLLNGPIADAIYHVGQVVSQRRTAGNPLSSKVNVFSGKTRE